MAMAWNLNQMANALLAFRYYTFYSLIIVYLYIINRHLPFVRPTIWRTKQAIKINEITE